MNERGNQMEWCGAPCLVCDALVLETLEALREVETVDDVSTPNVDAILLVRATRYGPLIRRIDVWD